MKTSMLASNDFTGLTFWLISMALLASTAFFFIERSSVKASWRTSMTLSGLATGIAFFHYLYLRDLLGIYWIFFNCIKIYWLVGNSPIVDDSILFHFISCQKGIDRNFLEIVIWSISYVNWQIPR